MKCLLSVSIVDRIRLEVKCLLNVSVVDPDPLGGEGLLNVSVVDPYSLGSALIWPAVSRSAKIIHNNRKKLRK